MTREYADLSYNVGEDVGEDKESTNPEVDEEGRQARPTDPTKEDIYGACVVAAVVELILEAHVADDGRQRGIRETYDALKPSIVDGAERELPESLLLRCAGAIATTALNESQRSHSPKVSDWTPVTANVVHERNQIVLIDQTGCPCLVTRDPIFEQVTISYILVVIDVFSKYVWLYAIPDKRPESVIQCLERLYDTVGYPLILQCDNGREFTAHSSLAFWSEKNVMVVRSYPRSPNENGQVE